MKILNKLSPDTLKIILFFLTWKALLIVVLLLSIIFLPLATTDKYLGGGSTNYHLAPELFSWANFDGEHFLSISIYGYKFLEQAFFPVFPLLISFFAKPFSVDLLSSMINYTLVGVVISNSVFLIALLFLFDLLRIDFSRKISYLSLILILIFPTSFYFGAVYSESLFLLFSVLSFLCARKGKWFWAGVFGFFSSATRVFGILLLPSLLIEAYQQRLKFSKIIWIFLIPMGMGFYMLYQYFVFGDPFAFYNLQTIVGEQHQKGIILPPQVYFRYLRMLFSIDITNPIYQTILLEFVVGIMFLALPIFGYFKKIRFSYIFYSMAGFLLPSIQGSFSSLPRYVLVLFPSFIALSLILDKLPRFLRISIIIGFTCLLALEAALFFRVYWIA